MGEAFIPEDLTKVDPDSPENLDFWARTLEVDAEKLRKATRRAGPELESVKKELGLGGV